jgi:NAD(P)-dependent dehydrogenase (short-subunit alcohol dehydrogenase family)
MSAPHVVVTGAASGIGAALCSKLLGQNYRVTGLDIAIGNGEYPIELCDLSDVASIQHATARIEGAIDGLALVAGLPGTHSARKVFDVNFLSARHVVQALAPRIVSNGSIVAVASIAAHRCAWEASRFNGVLAAEDDGARALVDADVIDGNIMYELSKRLLLHWVSFAAAQLAPAGIRVNAVSPGPVETPILKDFYSTIGEARMEASRQIVGRHGNPDEIADVIAFLLSTEARWVNGIEIKADGGMQALRGVAAQKATV